MDSSSTRHRLIELPYKTEDNEEIAGFIMAPQINQGGLYMKVVRRQYADVQNLISYKKTNAAIETVMRGLVDILEDFPFTLQYYHLMKNYKIPNNVLNVGKEYVEDIPSNVLKTKIGITNRLIEENQHLFYNSKIGYSSFQVHYALIIPHPKYDGVFLTPQIVNYSKFNPLPMNPVEIVILIHYLNNYFKKINVLDEYNLVKDIDHGIYYPTVFEDNRSYLWWKKQKYHFKAQDIENSSGYQTYHFVYCIDFAI